MSTKRDFGALEGRRLAGARLLKRNVPQAEVARRLGVSRQTASAWARQLAQANGAVGQLKAKPLGRPKRLDEWQCKVLHHWLIGGAQAAGFPNELWTIKRVRLLIAREFGVAYSKAGAWDLLRRLVRFYAECMAKIAIQQSLALILAFECLLWRKAVIPW